MTTEGTAAQPPAFDEPWQAQVYAMSQVLIGNGRVAPQDWANALGAAIRRRLDDGAPDTPETYFEAVTDALETVLGLDAGEIDGLIGSWRHAFETTPHGKPVKIKHWAK